MTRPLPDGITLRPAHQEDEARLGEIAFLTGFFGDSAARYFPDARLYGDLWVRPYLRGGGAASFVVEGPDGEGGRQVMGYVLGAADQGVYTRALLRVIFLRMIPHLFTGRYRQPWKAAPYLIRAALFASPHADWAVFPAHLHLNLLPGVRGLGLSRPLLEANLAALTALGVRGVQLTTTLENVAALRVYEKHGFTLVAAQRSALWTPWLGHPAEHVALARPL